MPLWLRKVSRHFCVKNILETLCVRYLIDLCIRFDGDASTPYAGTPPPGGSFFNTLSMRDQIVILIRAGEPNLEIVGLEWGYWVQNKKGPKDDYQ